MPIQRTPSHNTSQNYPTAQQTPYTQNLGSIAQRPSVEQIPQNLADSNTSQRYSPRYQPQNPGITNQQLQPQYSGTSPIKYYTIGQHPQYPNSGLTGYQCDSASNQNPINLALSDENPKGFNQFHSVGQTGQWGPYPIHGSTSHQLNST